MARAILDEPPIGLFVGQDVVCPARGAKSRHNLGPSDIILSRCDYTRKKTMIDSNRRRSLLAVFAHPDDEGLVTGSFAPYRAPGVRDALVFASRRACARTAPGGDR